MASDECLMKRKVAEITYYYSDGPINGLQPFYKFFLSHTDKPLVKIKMDPETAVSEEDRRNVSLSCEVVSGNPATLNSVRWYLDGELLKELPDCSPRNATTSMANADAESVVFCDIDPSKLLLESVGRSFHGNYSCEGKNDAGWGTTSQMAPLQVHCTCVYNFIIM